MIMIELAPVEKQKVPNKPNSLLFEHGEAS